MLAAAQLLANQALQANWRQPSEFATTHLPADLASAAFISAVDHALWDLNAQDAGKSVCEMLGGARRPHVPLYANINRRTLARTPSAFAQSTIDAIAAGFQAFKIAPFDEVQPSHTSLDSARDSIARVEAVRQAIGAERRLMVDCHWRFNEATAAELITQMARLHVHWVECPIAESHDYIAALVRLRGRANGLGVKLAGLELAIVLDGFMPYVEAGAYDVVMPDVKYFGGLQAMQRAADVFDRYGVQVSPHNPTGPVCHAASLQVSAAMRPLDMLELQFDESPLFGELVDGAFNEQASNLSALSLQTGLGVKLNAGQLQQLAVQPSSSWRATVAM